MTMNYAIAGAALLLLVACFDVAKKMSAGTWWRNPWIALSVITVGAGCVAAMFNAHQAALLIILAGRLMHYFADRRIPFYVASRDPAGDCSCTPAASHRAGQRATVFDIKTGDSVGGRARVSAVR